MVLHVRTGSDPAPLVAGLRGRIRELAPLIAIPNITTLRSHLGLATLPQRVAAAALGVLGALALLIAGIGLYGVVAFVVSQRMREFGIRSALGATASDVQRMVVAQGVRLALVGVAIGTAVSLVIAQLARGLLLVSPLDPVALLSVIAVLTATAALASWIPARRAMRADPLTVLRSE
jgi:putative ABC transport system permease protein